MDLIEPQTQIGALSPLFNATGYRIYSNGKCTKHFQR